MNIWAPVAVCLAYDWNIVDWRYTRSFPLLTKLSGNAMLILLWCGHGNSICKVCCWILVCYCWVFTKLWHILVLRGQQLIKIWRNRTWALQILLKSWKSLLRAHRSHRYKRVVVCSVALHNTQQHKYHYNVFFNQVFTARRCFFCCCCGSLLLLLVCWLCWFCCWMFLSIYSWLVFLLLLDV